MDQRTEKLASILVNYSTAVKPGERVLVEGPATGLPLLEALYVETLKAGGLPTLRVTHPSQGLLLCRHGNNEQISYFPDWNLDILKQTDVRLAIWAEHNTREMSKVDPKLQQTMMTSRKKYRELFFELAGSGKLRWCGTEFPTDATAQDAEMSLLEYEEFVYRACRVYEDDPVSAWKRVRERQQRLVDYLSDKSEVRVVAPGTDLTVGIQGRTWINASGDSNMPDGEVFTAPLEDHVNGTIQYSFPACYQGREVENVRLVFKDGRVVEEDATKGLDYLRAMLDMDEGARTAGEFAIGLNREIQDFSRNILFDEKIGGTCHVAVGAAYKDCGGSNESTLHWDMVCDLRQGGELYADGELFLKDGKFVVEGLRDL